MIVIYIIIASIFSLFTGYFVRYYIAISKKNSIELEIDKKILEAKKTAQKIEEDSLKLAEEIKQRLEKTELRLERKENDLDDKEKELKNEKEKLNTLNKEISSEKKVLIEKEEEINKKLENIAKLNEEDAKEIIFKKIENEYNEAILSRMLKLAKDGEQRLEKKANDILVSSIQRIANNGVIDLMTNTIELESDEIKGKIIGKEGRNIKTFEKVSGVELLIDEIPNAVVISCFDPVRRAIATNALEMLIKDGRIQPVKIEEFFEKAKKDIGIFIRKKGEEAILETGVLNIPDEIIPILGRLHFRTSYGQNVLRHSIEMAHIASILAEELNANIQIAKAAALVHDIGKAVDHEISGSHVEIGRKILKKYGADEKIILGMEAHHEEYPYQTIESIIVQTADAISGSRPGARRDSLENYIKRLNDLENIAMSFTGIDKVFAIQAGREIRVFVEPSLINDLEALHLAKNIAIRIEKEIKYPGEIKISVIRESRVIEFAR